MSPVPISAKLWLETRFGITPDRWQIQGLVGLILNAIIPTLISLAASKEAKRSNP
jgi:hypothetical protein